MIADLKPYAEYKDSGLPWLGHVPRHWQLRAVRHVTRPAKGKQPKKLFSEREAPAWAIPYLTMEYLRRHDGQAKVYCAPDDGLVTAATGDVLLLWDGANAGEFFMAKDGVVSSTAALLQTAEHERRYLYFMLRQCEPRLRALSTGMGIPHVDGGILKQMQICIPPPEEQVAIVRFLGWANGRLERAIWAKRKVIALLNEQKQATIHRAVTCGLDSSVPLKRSGTPWLGDIPQHWEVRRLSNVAHFLSGKAHEQFIDSTGENVCVTARFVSTGGKARKYCTKNFCPAAKHDVLMVMSDLPNGRALARSYLVQDDNPYAVNQRVCVLRAHAINPRLLAYWSNRNWHLMRNNDGLNQTHLSNYDFKTMPVLLPPTVEQGPIADWLDTATSDIDNASSRLVRECALLQEYSTRLVADVVTGKLDVGEAAARLPDEWPLETVEDEKELGDDPEPADEEAAV